MKRFVIYRKERRRPCKHPRTYSSKRYKRMRGRTSIINPDIVRRPEFHIFKKRKARILQGIMSETFIKKETVKIPEGIKKSSLLESYEESRRIKILTGIKNSLPQITKAVSYTISLFSGDILSNLAKRGVAYTVEYGTNEIIQGLDSSGFFEDIKEKLDLDGNELNIFREILRKTIEKILEYVLDKLIGYCKKIEIKKKLEEELNKVLVEEIIRFVEYTEKHGIDINYPLRTQSISSIESIYQIITQNLNRKKKVIIKDDEGNEHTVIATTEIRPIINSIVITIDIIRKITSYVRGKNVLYISGGIGSSVSISDIKLDLELRGKGLGKQIYLKAEEILREYNIKQITGTLSQVDCRTPEDRLRRNQFWTALGFEVIEIDDKGNGRIMKNL